MVLHTPSDEHSRVSDNSGAQPKVSLLDESGSLPKRFNILETLQKNIEPPSTKLTNRYMLCNCKVLFVIDQPHCI